MCSGIEGRSAAGAVEFSDCSHPFDQSPYLASVAIGQQDIGNDFRRPNGVLRQRRAARDRNQRDAGIEKRLKNLGLWLSEMRQGAFHLRGAAGLDPAACGF